MKVKRRLATSIIALVISLCITPFLYFKPVEASVSDPGGTYSVSELDFLGPMEGDNRLYRFGFWVYTNFEYTITGNFDIWFSYDGPYWSSNQFIIESACDIEGNSIRDLHKFEARQEGSTYSQYWGIELGCINKKMSKVYIIVRTSETIYKGLKQNDYIFAAAPEKRTILTDGWDYHYNFVLTNMEFNVADIADYVKSIHDYIVTGGDNTASAISAHLTDNVVINGNTSSTWKNLVGYSLLSKVNEGFEVVDNGIRCRKDGYVMVWGKVYAQPYVSSQVRVGANFTKNGTGISMTYSYMNFTGFNTLPIMAVFQVQTGDVISMSCNHNSSERVTINFATTLMAEYVVSSDTDQIMNALNEILVQLTRSYTQDQALNTEVLLKMDQIIAAIGDISSEQSQTIINNINTNINRDKQSVDQIDYDLLNQFNENKELLPLTDLKFTDGINDASTLYIDIFNGITSNPDIKALIIMTLLAALLMAMVG